MSFFGEIHYIYTCNTLVGILISSSLMFLYLVLVSVSSFSMHSYEKMKKEEIQLRKQKTDEIFICMKNELNSLKKDIEILAITK